jgi:hypothetical protein
VNLLSMDSSGVDEMSGASRTCVIYQRQIRYFPSVYPSLNEQAP